MNIYKFPSIYTLVSRLVRANFFSLSLLRYDTTLRKNCNYTLFLKRYPNGASETSRRILQDDRTPNAVIQEHSGDISRDLSISLMINIYDNRQIRYRISYTKSRYFVTLEYTPAMYISIPIHILNPLSLRV